MGLDQVEIIMRVEESFGLTIANADASKMRTVGDLSAYIVHHTGAKGLSACISSAAFYRSRKAFIEETGTPRNQIKLDSKLADLLPITKRRNQWQAIERKLGLRLPPLELSGWIILVICSLSLALTIPPLIYVSGHLHTGFLMFLYLVLPFSTFTVLLGAARFLATKFFAGSETFRGLTNQIVASNYGSLAEKLRMKDEQQIWLAVQCIVCDQMQMKQADVTYNSTWEELGIN